MYLLVLTVFCTIFILLLLALIIAAKKSTPPRRRRQQQQPPPPTSPSRYKELLNLLHGDKGAAQRLIDDCWAKNPGKTYEWVLHKVIRDLERDR